MTDKNLPKQSNASEKQYRTMRGIIYVGAGILIGGVLVSNCHDCKGNPTYDNSSFDAGVDASAYDAGDLSLYDAGVEDAGDSTCYGSQYVQDLEQKLEQCGNELKECRETNEKLSNRPESCPKYKPCPPKDKFPAYRRY